MNPWEQLLRQAGNQARRMRKAEREQASWLGQTAFLGCLGLCFGLPVVAGAYLGIWLDNLAVGYSVRWTVGLIVLGVAVGAYNVYRLIQE